MDTAAQTLPKAPYRYSATFDMIVGTLLTIPGQCAAEVGVAKPMGCNETEKAHNRDSIVRALNAHAALVKALAEAEDALDDISAALPDSSGIADPALERVRAALALAHKEA